MATIEDTTGQTTRHYGKRGISEKDAINAVGRQLSAEVRAESNHLDSEIGNTTRNLSSDLRSETNHLNRDIGGVGRSLATDLRSESDHITRDVSVVGRNLSDAVCNTRFDSVLATEQAKSQILQEVSKQGCKTDSCNDRGTASTNLLVETATGRSILEDQKNKYDLAKEIWSSSRSSENLMISGFKDGRYDSAQSTAAIQNSLVSGFKDGRYDSAQSTAAIQSAMVAGFKDGRYDACQNTMSIQLALKDQALLSQQLASQAAKELAECCCEIREKISCDGEKTRSLLNEQARLDSVRRELKLENELLFSRNNYGHHNGHR